MTSLRLLVLTMLTVSACAAGPKMLGNSQIQDTPFSRGVIETIETYRTALERQDAKALLLMASKDYREDSGTPTGSDDYGYDGLRQVLAERLGKVREVRYAVRYVAMRSNCGGVAKRGCKAAVEAIVDASFTVKDAMGNDRRPDKRDQSEFVLQWSGDKWLFLSGM
ncbi:MAG: hypothetical protein R3B48_01360 [Kofleriaceae bacterium]